MSTSTPPTTGDGTRTEPLPDQPQHGPWSDDQRLTDPAPGSVTPPANPLDPGRPLEPFRAVLTPPRLHQLPPGAVHDVDIAATVLHVHPDLPAVPAWGYGLHGAISSPGPWLEVTADRPALIRWRNRLPGSLYPRDPSRPRPTLPLATSVVTDPNPDDSRQNYLGADGGVPQSLDGAPVGWTTTHLHGAHVASDSDGWPDNMTASGSSRLSSYDNTIDNADLGLGKVGAFLWYHDHAMNGTRYHVVAGLAGGYLVRHPRERLLGLPTDGDDGEIPLLLADRNLDAGGGAVRLLHKVTTDTAEFFGPLTLVNGLLWPRLPLRPEVYRLRLLNGSNARAYRLHLIGVRPADPATGQDLQVEVHHDRLLVIGTEGGLLWRGVPVAAEDALTVAPAERLDVLVDLTGLADGTRLYLVNSAQAPFGGDAPPPLDELWRSGDRPGRNPYPWVLRLDVDGDAPNGGRPGSLPDRIRRAELNPAFRRLVHQPTTPAPDAPPEFPVDADHAHRVILLAETTPPGHLYLQEAVEDPDGTVELQLSPTDPGPKRYRVENWLPADRTPSDRRVSFYDRTAIRPQVGRWEIWRLVNTTGDTHPIHIHQSTFQPLGDAGVRLQFDTPDPTDPASTINRYDPLTRMTSPALLPDPTTPARAFDPAERTGWKDVVRVDPGNVVAVAVRFDLPGRYVYHCHVLEHEDTEMMRPFVVTVLPMDDGGGMAM